MLFVAGWKMLIVEGKKFFSNVSADFFTERLTYVKKELKKNNSIQLNLKKQIKKQNKKDYLVQPPF